MKPLSETERALCTELLQRIADEPALIDNDERLKGLIARIHKEGRRSARLSGRTVARENDRRTQQEAALARRDAGVTSEPNFEATGKLKRGVRCYICKQNFQQVHFFYHLLCPTCAALNWEKRTQRADLTGRVALVTGARIKIGFELTLMLLRDGATVLATTRFPRDAARRFAAQPDASEWRDRLHLFGLDLRFLPTVESFARQIDTLDILIHNAAQTIRRPTAYYAPLLAAEAEPIPQLASRWLESDAPLGALTAPSKQGELSPWFPAGALDRDGQPLDARPMNSWRLRVGEVEPVEAAEAMLIGALAPFLLTDALRPVLTRSEFARRFVISVSAMEGQFARESKTSFHPHTNMAKAALNMLTRTSASDLAQEGIYLNSVDTGWVTDENPLPVRERTEFLPPLDCIDGAARVYDPILRGLKESEPPYGQFFKDYAPYPW